MENRKPISEWTLKEVQEMCDNRNNCTECTFYDSGNCEVCRVPVEWPLGKAEAVTGTVEYTHYPAAAAEAPDKPAKPRLAEILGVEVREIFRIEGESNDYYVDQEGILRMKNGGNKSVSGVYKAINHPDSIIRLPRLTEAELERCRVYNAKYITRDPKVYFAKPRVYLWKDMPARDINGDYNGDNFIADVDADYFPSVRPGDCICVEEATL